MYGSIVCNLSLLLLFMVVGCATYARDKQSDVPYTDLDADSHPEKASLVERPLISNEVNCIAADLDNVWIATVSGVSRWARDSDKWFHYTMEDGL